MQSVNTWLHDENRCPGHRKGDPARHPIVGAPKTDAPGGPFHKAQQSNTCYKKAKGERLLKYLRKGCGECRWKLMARYRLGNEVKRKRYWERKEKRL